MSKILVTGGAGFIGSHITDSLISNGHQVVVVDNLFTGDKNNLNKDVKFYDLDIQDKKLGKIFKKEKFDYVFHLAAQINLRLSIKDPIFDAQNNILGSLNLFENCIKHKVKKIIFSSTGGAICGDAEVIPTSEECHLAPISPYGIAKFSIEKYLHYYYLVHGLKYIALRYSNVYGPRQNPKGEAGVIAIFINKLLKKQQPIINGDGNQTRDYVYVDDVVQANLLALDNDKIGAFNVSSGKETSVNVLFHKLNKLTGAGLSEKHAPAIAGEQQRSCLDCTKIKKELDWEPTIDLDQGLQMTVDWFKK